MIITFFAPPSEWGIAPVHKRVLPYLRFCRLLRQGKHGEHPQLLTQAQRRVRANIAYPPPPCDSLLFSLGFPPSGDNLAAMESLLGSLVDPRLREYFESQEQASSIAASGSGRRDAPNPKRA